MIGTVKGHASAEVKMTAAAEPTNISIQRGGGGQSQAGSYVHTQKATQLVKVPKKYVYLDS